jgi:hypothetical protein
MKFRRWAKPIYFNSQENGLKIYLSEKEIKYHINNECWECISHNVNSSGYSVKHSGLIHREVYVVCNGEIPENMQVCHTCDNRRCINPKHLWIGTLADNQNDKIKKNRQSRLCGEMNGRAKLSKNQVYSIRNDNRLLREISVDYKISNTLVSKIKRNEVWNAMQ